MKVKKSLLSWLRSRYQLVVRSEEDLAERSIYSFNYAGLIAWVTFFFVLMVALSMALAVSILSKWLNPAYMDQKNQQELRRLTEEVAGLEQQTKQQKKFIGLLQNIIAGKEPPVETVTQPENAPQTAQLDDQPLVQPAEEEASLRSEFEEGDFTPFSARSKSVTDLQGFIFFPPVSGIVTMPFQKKNEHYGVDIVAEERAPIQCVADGTVILSSWTVETGWVMMVQHENDLVSVYKHNAALLQKVGSFVRAGDVIAIMGNSGKLSTGPHLHFELWHEGSPINPEHFIVL